jgi:hypothetical protein
MKSYETKKRYKTRAKKKRKTKGDKEKLNQKRRKNNKILSQKSKKGARKKTWQKAIKGWNRRSRFCHMNC